jgi:hypothetical protein
MYRNARDSNHRPDTLQFTAPLLGEPLNVILSGLSDPLVLTEDGFREYTK